MNNLYIHRWARLLTQQTSITIYCLTTQENKLPFSVCRKQAEVCRFHFPFAFRYITSNCNGTVTVKNGYHIKRREHKWTHVLKQQSSIIVHCLMTKENKLPFSTFVCSKQTEVCRSRFPGLQQTNVSCRFPWVHFPFAKFRKHGDMDMEI